VRDTNRGREGGEQREIGRYRDDERMRIKNRNGSKMTPAVERDKG